MSGLLGVLTSIALVDSTSIIPLSLVPLSIYFNGRRPLLTASSFLAGILVCYMLCGVLIAFGMSAAFDTLNVYFARLWKNPDTLELVVQLIIGGVLLWFGVVILRGRGRKSERSTPPASTPLQAFTLGAVMTVTGMPGAVPYLAAIDTLLRADLSGISTVLGLAFYNVVFLLPLVVLVVIRQLWPERAGVVFAAISRFFENYGAKLIGMALLLLGGALVLDGVGFLFDEPFLPVGD